jgi:hypothetical protein
VIDRGVIIPDGLVVGEDPVEDERWFRRTDAGIVLVTQDMLDARAAVLADGVFGGRRGLCPPARPQAGRSSRKASTEGFQLLITPGYL